MFKKEWDDMEIKSIALSEVGKEKSENGNFKNEEQEVVLEGRIKQICEDVGNIAWKSGKKEGFVQGVFIGVFLSIMISAFI